MQLLEAQNISKIFGGGLLNQRQITAVDEISLHINEEKPTITAIAGESGSGKTTLARLLLGMTQPSSGSIRFRGQDLTTMSKHDRRGAQVTLEPQLGAPSVNRNTEVRSPIATIESWRASSVPLIGVAPIGVILRSENSSASSCALLASPSVMR
jgi:ABC-type oligopeptide transport system ATPase subunit